MTNGKRGVNFGCGLNVTDNWVNYDASPTLWLQRMPLLGIAARRIVKPVFPRLARYGDIVKGLPEHDATVDWVYCSHILEHLALDDLRSALIEVMRILKPGGVFRGVLPDLEADIQSYLQDHADAACSNFMIRSGMGLSTRTRGLSGLLRSFLGNSQHLWL